MYTIIVLWVDILRIVLKKKIFELKYEHLTVTFRNKYTYNYYKNTKIYIEIYKKKTFEGNIPQKQYKVKTNLHFFKLALCLF